MRSLLLATLIFLDMDQVSASDPHRDPAMDFYGPTVVQETIEDPTKGAFDWEVAYIGDIGRNFTGGYRVGSSYAGLAAARGYFDLDKALGWQGTSLFVHLQGTHGSTPSLVTGDAQIASNIESYSNTVRFMETWMKQSFLNDRAFFLFGLLDLNAEFYLTESSLMFVNSSMGLGTEMAQLGPDGRTASTFPVTSLAAMFKYKAENHFYFDAAVFDAMPGAMTSTGTHIDVHRETEGFMLINEIGWHPETSKVALGSWTYTKPYDTVKDETETAKNYGFYVMGEHKFTKQFTAFARYGAASETVNRIKDNIAAGFVYEGLFPGRDEDELGLGFTRVGITDSYKEMLKDQGEKSEDGETVIELTYKYKVAKHLTLQPDLQYIIDPNANPSFTNALTGFLRVQIDFAK